MTSLKLNERICSWIARHLPRRIAYWCVIHAIAYHSRKNPKQEVPAIAWHDALTTWEQR